MDERKEASQLLGVNLSEPKRSDTLKTYMANKEYTDKDIIHEDDNSIVFNSRPDREEYAQNDYDKKTDQFNVLTAPESAEKYNTAFAKRADRHRSFASSLLKPISSEEECAERYNEFLINYANGIIKQSGNNLDQETAIQKAKTAIGPYREFKRTILSLINNK